MARSCALGWIFMRTWDQEVLSDHSKGVYGDCARACLRTYLQDPLKGCPHPIDSSNGMWNPEYLSYLESRNIDIKRFANRPGRDASHVPNLVIAVGPAPRGVSHAVVYDRARKAVLHDPHPSRSGLLAIDWFWWV